METLLPLEKRWNGNQGSTHSDFLPAICFVALVRLGFGEALAHFAAFSPPDPSWEDNLLLERKWKIIGGESAGLWSTVRTLNRTRRRKRLGGASFRVQPWTLISSLRRPLITINGYDSSGVADTANVTRPFKNKLYTEAGYSSRSSIVFRPTIHMFYLTTNITYSLFYSLPQSREVGEREFICSTAWLPCFFQNLIARRRNAARPQLGLLAKIL